MASGKNSKNKVRKFKRPISKSRKEMRKKIREANEEKHIKAA